MRAYKIEVGKDIELVEIDKSLKTLRNFVGGYIEAVAMAPNTFMICNEDGKDMGLKPNFAIINENGHILDVVAGNVLFVGFNGAEDFDDVTDEGMNIIKKKIRFYR